MWRPCLAALVATMLAAAPALASLLATEGDDDAFGEPDPRAPQREHRTESPDDVREVGGDAR